MSQVLNVVLFAVIVGGGLVVLGVAGKWLDELMRTRQ